MARDSLLGREGKAKAPPLPHYYIMIKGFEGTIDMEAKGRYASLVSLLLTASPILRWELWR